MWEWINCFVVLINLLCICLTICRIVSLPYIFCFQGNKSVCRSADEYSVAVDTSRGLKEFQYDQVFMEDSTQEKIFEDANVCRNYILVASLDLASYCV